MLLYTDISVSVYYYTDISVFVKSFFIIFSDISVFIFYVTIIKSFVTLSERSTVPAWVLPRGLFIYLYMYSEPREYRK